MKAAIFMLCGTVFAQQTLTVRQAVDAALKNYPAAQVSQEQIAAAAAAIDLARTAYLPRVDALAQVNRATRNNVFGLLLPQSVIPSMSGPVIGTNNFGTAWGSVVGVLVSWEPYDFGLRRARVATASATKAQAEASLKRTQYEIAAATADAYLTLAAAQETIRAAQAGVDRAEVIARVVNAQVNAQLRPGADASRAEAELAAARTQLIQTREAADVAQTTVAKFVGIEQVAIAIGRLTELPPDRQITALDPAANPVSVEQATVIEQVRAQIRELERSYFPRFNLQGSAYARGTGAETNGTNLGWLNGLAPNTQNYAAGLTVTFGAMDLPALQAREAEQAATIRAQTAKLQQIATDLKAQFNAAVARWNGARNVVANTPIQVKAARDAVQQSTARYQSGLATIDSVAEAQRLLTQAEIDDALARLSVWRALLEIATAAGDLQPFLAEASQ
jgi:outer membrane protein TolC